MAAAAAETEGEECDDENRSVSGIRRKCRKLPISSVCVDAGLLWLVLHGSLHEQWVIAEMRELSGHRQDDISRKYTCEPSKLLQNGVR